MADACVDNGERMEVKVTMHGVKSKERIHFEAYFEINHASIVLKTAYHLKPICNQL